MLKHSLLAKGNPTKVDTMETTLISTLKGNELSVVAHAFNPSTTEAGGRFL